MMTRLVVITYVLLQVLIGSAVSQNDPDGLDYLMKYGYFDNDDGTSGSIRSSEFVTQSIMKFQKMVGLPVTGEMTDETREWMKKPRCGVSDNMGNSDAARKKRYALFGDKWRKTDLTYKLSRSSRTLNRMIVEKELQRAFDVWSKHTPLTFTPSRSNKVDIDIFFASGSHGDAAPFDGPSNTLAHAYSPKHGGDVHFDDDETFTHQTSHGINLFQVAAHEFGHSLGLSHSDVPTALMAPIYTSYQPSFELHGDDIAAIQELYGRKVTTGVTTKKPYAKPTRRPVMNIPDICRDSVIDAITMTEDGTTYAFKDEYYYRLNAHGIDSGYPKKISADWVGSTGPVDSVITLEDGYTYIFKGSNFWKYKNMRFVYGPTSIEEGFPGLPDNIDAAFVWGGNGKTYFMKGTKYWRYNVGRRMDYGYPRPMSAWKGLPNEIGAAFQWENRRTYFFHKESYYRFNDKRLNVDRSYPRPTSTWWLGCPDKEQIIQYDENKANGNAEINMTLPDNSEKDLDTDQWLVGMQDGNSSSSTKTISAILVTICLVSVHFINNSR